MLADRTGVPSSGVRPGRQPNEESRSRTFTGCRTCRNRHVKCDEAKPKCSTCRRGNIPCEGYAPRLLWVAEQPANPDPADREERNAYRYPLFSEKARSSMSLELVESLGNQPAGRMVMDLENETVTGNPGEYRSAGPFGVFRAFDDPTTSERASHSRPPPPDENQREQPRHTDHLDGGNMTRDPLNDSPERSHTQLEVRQPSNALNEDTSATFATDPAAEIEDWLRLGSQFCGSSPAPFSFDSFGMDPAFLPMPSSDPFSLNGPSARSDETLHYYPPVEGQESPATGNADEKTNIEVIPRSVPAPIDADGGGALPMHAAELLRYLRAEVLKGPSPRLSPWRKLMLPRALETFAELTLWNTTSHTRLGILCALLAKSAYHLHRSLARDSQQSSRWREVAFKHQNEAQKHLKTALRTEVEGHDRVEYTDLLMAMLGVCFVSVSGPA